MLSRYSTRCLSYSLKIRLKVYFIPFHSTRFHSKTAASSTSRNSQTHPEHVTLSSAVAGFLGDEGDGVVESVLERTRTEAGACGDAARHHYAGAHIRWMLQEFAVTCPEGTRQESVIHGQAVKYEIGGQLNKMVLKLFRHFTLIHESSDLSAFNQTQSVISFHHRTFSFPSTFSSSVFAVFPSNDSRFYSVDVRFPDESRRPSCGAGAAGIWRQKPLSVFQSGFSFCLPICH